jgi:type II secretory pathway pseudopilin PulG
MTLLELMVAIAITGMMAVAGATTFSSIIDHRRVIRESTLATERAVALRELVRGWIAAGNILIQAGGVPRGFSTSARTGRGGMATGVTAAASIGDEITITTTALMPSLSPTTRIRLFVDGDSNTPEKGLTIEYQGSNNSPLQRRELDSTIGTMTVELLDNRTGRWYASGQGAAITPVAVRFHFAATDGDSIPRILSLPFVYKLGDVQQQRGSPVQ